MTVEVFYVRDDVGAGGAGYALVLPPGPPAWSPARSTPRRAFRTALATAAMLALAVQGAGRPPPAAPVLAWVMAGYRSAASVTASRTC